MKERLQAIHFWIAIVLCLPIVIVGLTGSAVVFRPEIEGYANPAADYRVHDGTRHSVDQMVLTAAKSAPAGFRPMAYIPPADATRPAEIVFAPGDPRNGKSTLYGAVIDPVTLQVVGSLRRTAGFLDVVQELHSTLLAGAPGRIVLGWIGIGMFLLGITGLCIRLMWAQNLLRAFSLKTGSRGFVLWRDLHGLTGMIGFVFFIVVTFTGIFMSVPQVKSAMIAIFAPDVRKIVEGPPKFSPVTHVAILDEGQTATKPGEKFLASLGSVHAGDIGGLPLRIIVFLTGLLPTVFVVTGLNMWWIKRKARVRPRTTFATASDGARE